MTLAGILRTDAHAHRPLPADTDLARAHQDAIWRRTRASNALRSLLREYFPVFLAAFADRTTNLAGRDARAVLAIALTPTAAAKLPRTRIAAALRRAGRQRGIDQLARRIQQALQQPQLHQPPLVEQAMGEQARALLAVLDAECGNVDQLGQAVAEAFTQHPRPRDHRQLSWPGRRARGPVAGRDRRRPGLVRRRSRAEGLRRIGTDHPRLRAKRLHHPALDALAPSEVSSGKLRGVLVLVRS